MICKHCGGTIDQAEGSQGKPEIAQRSLGLAPAGLESGDGLFPEAPRASGNTQGNGTNRRPRTGKTRLPPDWKPSPELEAYARAQGIVDLNWAWETFRLHFDSPDAAKWSDWSRVWQKACRGTWLRKPRDATLSKFTKPGGGNSDGGGWMPPAEPWEARLSGFKKTGFWLPQNYGPPPGEPGCRVPKELLT